MSVGVNPPKTPLTKGSNGIGAASMPNVCKMPGPPAPFVPAPLPNIGKSGDKPKGYSKKVKIEKKSVAIKGASFCSMGDVASKGTGGGLISANTHGPCKFISPGSSDVKIEGKNTHQLSDMVTNNGGGSGNPANAATMTGTVQAPTTPGRTPKPECPDESICKFEKEPRSGVNENKTLDEARDDFRRHAGSLPDSQARGAIAEARGIEHNRQERNDGRGTLKEGKDTSRMWHCTTCGKDREVDQVLRDDDGNITGIVEVKSGNNLRGQQGKFHKIIASQNEIKYYKKVQKKGAVKKCINKGLDHFDMSSTPMPTPL